MRFTNGFLRQSSSGKWVGVLKYRDACGQWRQVTKTLSRDRAEAECALALWRAEMNEPCAGHTTRPGFAAYRTVEEVVRECLGAQLTRGRIERSTFNTQLAYCERAVFPELGALALEELDPALLQAWVDRLCLRLAPGSVRNAYSVLHKACAQAAVRGELASNPMEGVEPPARTPPARAYLPDTSIAQLEGAVNRAWGEGGAWACATRLALYAGLRAGECCALRWRDVDLARGRLRVVASIGRAADGPYLKPPKCAASAREFPVTAALVRALEARLERAGSDPQHFVCGERDAFANPRSLSTAFSRLCEHESIVDSDGRRATFHMLRHTFATRAVLAGVDVRTLADLMGHARADVTLNVYAASGEDAKLAAVARMEELSCERAHSD